MDAWLSGITRCNVNSGAKKVRPPKSELNIQLDTSDICSSLDPAELTSALKLYNQEKDVWLKHVDERHGSQLNKYVWCKSRFLYALIAQNYIWETITHCDSKRERQGNRDVYTRQFDHVVGVYKGRWCWRVRVVVDLTELRIVTGYPIV
jgi:hypothetical protein